MKHKTRIRERKREIYFAKLEKIMQCLCSVEQFHVDEVLPSSISIAAKDYSASVYSSQTGDIEGKPDTGNIEEAETSLRAGGCLNYEEARALLGRYEYQKGNLEAALHVFEGIDIASVIPKVKITLSAIGEVRKRRSQNYATPPLSIHAVSLLLEAILLKSKSYKALGKYEEAAKSCSVILDIVESSLPQGLPVNFGSDYKFQETVTKAVELLPELWKLDRSSRDSIQSYRRALLHNWNLDAQTIAKIQKEFAIFLLYSGAETIAPNLHSQTDTSFVPKNNIEEAVILLIIILRKISLKMIDFDPSILNHLTYALSISGGLSALVNLLDELLPGVVNSRERYDLLALCHHTEGNDLDALDCWQKLLNRHAESTDVQALLFASKTCMGNSKHITKGIDFAHRAKESSYGGCDQLIGVAHYMLGICLSEISGIAMTDSERVKRQSEALESLEIAGRTTKMSSPAVVYRLSLQYAEQRKLEPALDHAKWLAKLEGGSNLKGWILLARVLSAQKRFADAESIINAALDQSGIWDQGELLRCKAKLQIAQGLVKEAVETFSRLLAVIQVQNKSSAPEMKLDDRRNLNRVLEMETWHNLASIYIRLSQWHDAELCLSKSEAISSFSAGRLYTNGLLYEAKGDYKEALNAYELALGIDPAHVPSLISKASVLRQIGCQSSSIIRTFLTEALRLDRMNSSAWYNLGLLYKDGDTSLSVEAAECFKAAIILEETEPIEPFR